MDPIQIFVICFYLMGSCTLLLCLVYFLQELKAQRFSLKNTFNKFNTSWLICYIGVGASIIGDMAFTIPNSQLGTKIFMRLLSGWSLPMTLCGWLYYMYFRSNLVMADSPWQVRVKWMSIISVIVQIAAACYRTQGILVDPTASALPISHNIVTVISSLMVMGCAFFYCYFFTRYFHNAKVKSVGAHNRKGQIIAFYGNFSSAMAASALLIFLLRLAVNDTMAILAVVFCMRLCLVVGMGSLVLIKFRLKRFEAEYSKATASATSQVSKTSTTDTKV